MVSNIMLTLAFLAAVLAVYYLVPVRERWGILLAASLLFYMSANPWMVLLVSASAVWSWFAGLKMEQAITKERKRGWLLGCILPLLGVLFLFKYLNFFIGSVASLLSVLGLETDPFVLRLLLPMGISYYTFKLISYGADVYQGKREAERHMGHFLTYVLFFPQILSGPIERSECFLPQLKEGPVYDGKLFAQGLQLVILGLFKKIVIANRLSAYVNTIYGAPESYPGLASLMAAFFYSFQIYCDFSGYSDIAIGMGNMLGICSRKNFNQPYFARNIKDFWNRWHISLSSWLKDYIYIPLGGNRVSKLRKNLNILATFLVSGIWHGDNWTFLVWGGIHGVWNMAGGRGRRDEEQAGGLRKLWQTLVTFLGVTFAWIFFRAESLGDAVHFIGHMAADFSLSFGDIQNSILPFTGDNTCAAYFLTVCLFLFLLFLYEWRRVYGGEAGKAPRETGHSGRENPLSVPWIIIMTAAVLLFGVFGESGFLYAQF